MLTYRVIPPSVAATRPQQVAAGRGVYYVMPSAPLAWEMTLYGQQTSPYPFRWPARIEQLIDDRPDGRLVLLVVTESGVFRTVAPYSEQRDLWTWHLADEHPGEPTKHLILRAATDDDIRVLSNTIQS